MSANPLVAERVNRITPLSGTFLLEDCESIASGIRNGDWLDGLTGDAGEVAAFAATWENIAGQMQDVSAEMTRILSDLDDQHGQFFDTYRQFQGENAAHAAAAGRLASAMGVGMQIASTIVQVVHDMVRDALTQLAGTAISAATTAAAATLGFGTPWAVAQVATRVSALSARVGKYVTKLVKAIKELLPRLDDAARLFRSLRKALDNALEGASDTVRSAVRKGDDVRTPRRPELDQFGRPRTAPEAGRGIPDGPTSGHHDPAGRLDPESPGDLHRPTFDNTGGKDFGHQEWDETVHSLPVDEQRSIKDYTRDPNDAHAPGDFDYKDINEALRSGQPIKDPHLAQTIDNIQHSLERTRTPEDLTVARGLNLQNQEWLKADLASDLPGRVIPNESFISTTLGDQLPKFADEMDGVMYLDVPKGTPAMYLDSIRLHPSEGELLLGKGLDIHITSAIQDSAGKWHVHAKIVAP